MITPRLLPLIYYTVVPRYIELIKPLYYLVNTRSQCFLINLLKVLPLVIISPILHPSLCYHNTSSRTIIPSHLIILSSYSPLLDLSRNPQWWTPISPLHLSRPYISSLSSPGLILPSQTYQRTPTHNTALPNALW